MVSRELKRNCDGRRGKYEAGLAQRKADKRKKSKPHNIRFTDEIKRFVEDRLAQDYSPEQIVGRAKLDGFSCVSHECIYQYVWADKHKGDNIHTHFRHKGRKYRKRGSSKDSRGIIKNRVDISLRPDIVNVKKRFGDLEIDTIIGKNHKGAILTINDRMTGMVWIRKLSGKDADELAAKTIEAILPLKSLVETITSDNGKEFAKHNAISEALGIEFYFARPYHSWERGANENTNGLIRQYIPKGCDFETIDNKYIECIEKILNNRPRKRLNFMTPIEYFNLYLINNKVAFAA